MSKFDNHHDYYIDKAKRVCHKSITHPLFRTFSKQNLTFFAFLPYFLVLLLKRFGVYEFLLYFCMQ